MTQNKFIGLTNISKTFGGLVAVDDLNLDLFPGQIIGLVGANGSGKTTLMNILCGNLHPDTGGIWILENPVKFNSTSDAISHGIRMLPQNLEIYESLSVLENIFIGQEITRNIWFPRLVAWKKMEKTAEKLLEKVDANTVSPSAMIENLSGGQKKVVLLARLLAMEAKLLIFDEPMASLGIKQKQKLFKIFKSEAKKGCAIVFISHNIEDVIKNCDRVVVLRHGKIIKDMLCEQTDLQEVSSLIMQT